MKQPIQTLRQHREASDKAYLQDVLPHFDTLTAASKALGITYNTLWRHMRQFGLSHD